VSRSDDDEIGYAQGQTVVKPMSLKQLLMFTADVLRDRTRDPYNRALADELYERSKGLCDAIAS
jgi:hypothetical protein